MCQQLREPREPLVGGVMPRADLDRVLGPTSCLLAFHPQPLTQLTWAEDPHCPSLGQVSLPPSLSMHSNREVGSILSMC